MKTGHVGGLVRGLIIGAVLLIDACQVSPYSSNASENSIADLIGARLALMKDVAAYKHINDIAIEDREREAVVLAHAVDKAEAAGLEGSSIVAFFTAQIDAAKAIQQCWIERWQQGSARRPIEAPDLQNDIRPQLIDLGDRIVTAIAERAAEQKGLADIAVPAIDCLPDDRAEAIAASLTTVAVSPE